jgi:hypothetical protein
MFTNKKDPLVDAVKSVMYEGNLKRQVEEAVNNHFGVSSRKAIPHEHLAEYDDLLSESYKQAIEEGNIKHPNQQKLDVHEPEKDKLTSKDEEFVQLDEIDLSKSKAKRMLDRLNKKLDARQIELLGTKVDMNNPKHSEILHKDKTYRRLNSIYTRAWFANEKVPYHPWKKKPATIKDFAMLRAGKKIEEKSKKMDESIESIMEEIRVNLEEQLVAVYESGDEQMFEEFVSSLTEEQLEILGLNEDWRGALASTGGFDFGGGGYQTPSRVAAAQARGAARSAGPQMPSAAPTTGRVAPTAARQSAAPAAGRPAPAPTARPATPAPSPAARQSAAPAAGRPAPAPSPAAKPTGTSQTGASNVSPESGYGRANLPINQQQTNQQLPDRSKPEYYSRENIAKRAETTAQNIPAAKAAKETQGQADIKASIDKSMDAYGSGEGTISSNVPQKPAPGSHITAPQNPFPAPSNAGQQALAAAGTPMKPNTEIKPPIGLVSGLVSKGLSSMSAFQSRGAASGAVDAASPEAASIKPKDGGYSGAAFNESTHLKESLESFIRNKFIKG